MNGNLTIEIRCKKTVLKNNFFAEPLTEASVRYKYNAEVYRKVIIKSLIVPDYTFTQQCGGDSNAKYFEMPLPKMADKTSANSDMHACQWTVITPLSIINSLTFFLTETLILRFFFHSQPSINGLPVT